MIHAESVTEKLELSPASVTNGATGAATIDCLGAGWASIRVALSNITSATIASADGVTIKLTESNDTNVSNATTFVANQTGIKFGRLVRYEVDMRARKRYLVLNVIPGTSGVTNEPVTVSAISTMSRKAISPGATTAMTGASNDAIIFT